MQSTVLFPLVPGDLTESQITIATALYNFLAWINKGFGAVSIVERVEVSLSDMQIVTMLNRLGHALSESQISEIETGMAENILHRQRQASALVPSNKVG